MDFTDLIDRRLFVMLGMAAGAAFTAGWAWPKKASAAGTGKFEVPPLPYPYEALEPHIDKVTMQFHHDKHHQAYVDNLNKALDGQAGLQGLSLDDLLANKAAKVPDAIRQAVINNGGGHYNHSLFWEMLAPNAGGEPKGQVADAIKATFGDFKTFTEKMNDAGLKRFGSGWVWLVKTADGKLDVYSTANQDAPIMEGKTALLGFDVWEHAYYLKYQNRRAEYLKAIWNVVNWPFVEKRFSGGA
ncbi:MAG TPA: superoxide dismutase [Planctomycetota bacterium]|jgi:Fe-Mn family superoxide dismutase